MFPCNQCLENYWEKKRVENVIVAHCFFCGYEVQFTAKNYHIKFYNKKKKRKKISAKRKMPPKSYLKEFTLVNNSVDQNS